MLTQNPPDSRTAKKNSLGLIQGLPSRVKYYFLGKASRLLYRRRYANFHPSVGQDAAVLGLDKQVASLESLLHRRDLERFLKRLSELALLIGPDPQVWGSALFVPELDELARRAGLTLAHRTTAPAKSNVLLHVATELYSFGGHTRVIEDAILSLPEYQHVLLMTGPYEQHPEFPRVKPMLDRLPVEFRSLRAGTCVARAVELSSTVAAISPDTILLFTHPDDATANVAIDSRCARRVLFFHHVDHFPSLGASRSDYAHIDLTPACHSVCQSRPPLRASMLNLTVRDIGTAKFAHRAEVIGVTCGSPHKYEGATEFSYAQLLAALFASGVDRILHIGQMPEEQKAQIRGEVTANSQDPERIVFLPNTPSLAAKLIEISPDFYLVSHPTGSGKATVEAMSVGLPILHARPDSTLPLLNSDVTFGTSVMAPTLEQIPSAIQRLRNERESLARDSRRAYERHYSPQAFRQGLLTAITHG